MLREANRASLFGAIWDIAPLRFRDIAGHRSTLTGKMHGNIGDVSVPCIRVSKIKALETVFLDPIWDFRLSLSFNHDGGFMA